MLQPMLSRRGLIFSGAALIASPAIVSASSLMAIYEDVPDWLPCDGRPIPARARELRAALSGGPWAKNRLPIVGSACPTIRLMISTRPLTYGGFGIVPGELVILPGELIFRRAEMSERHQTDPGAA